MQPKIEFEYAVSNIWKFPAGREQTRCAVTCAAGVFQAEVIRDSRDQPNRRIARMKALEKAIAPLPRAQRIEVWTAWNNRTRPRPATSAAGTSASSTTTSGSIQTADTETKATT